MRFAEAVYSLAIAVWVGGLVAIGYLAAPVLFSQLSDRAVAGNIAGMMFSFVGWAGMVCGTYLVIFVMARKGWRCVRSFVFWIPVTMLAITSAGLFGIQPLLAQLKAEALPRQVMESALRDRFSTWHGLSSGLYLLNTLLGVLLVVIQERGKTR